MKSKPSPLHLKTPLLENRRLSAALNKNILNKMECWQPSGSFKNRGISFLCEHYAKQGKKAFVSSSGGNAGLAVAYAGRHLKLPVTVFVPQTTSEMAISRIKLEGADVVVTGHVWDDTNKTAMQAAEEQDAAFIPPFDNPLIWEGHATLVEELAEQTNKPDAIVLSVGGGGLMCGVAQGLQKVGWDDVPIIAVETKGCDSLHAALQAKKLVSLDSMTSICTSLGAKRVAEQAFNVAQATPVHSVVTTDARAVNAILTFADDMRTLVEPACGAALSIVYDNHDIIQPYQNIVVIVCGGTGVSLEQLHAWREKFL